MCALCVLSQLISNTQLQKIYLGENQKRKEKRRKERRDRKERERRMKLDLLGKKSEVHFGVRKSKRKHKVREENVKVGSPKGEA